MFNKTGLMELINRYREGRLAHAYLIETNDLDEAILDIKELLKVINCPNEYKEECSECNLCNLINKNNLPSLKIIEPEGANIKKAQIEELKEDYSSIPLYSKYNTYIIKNAEKLNASSANSMLKFIEEPTPGILGFFITTNKDIMIDTIKSRCQQIVLKYQTDDIIKDLGITEEEYNDYVTNIKSYLTKLNSKNMINHKIELISKYPERKDIIIFFQIIFQIYYENFLKNNNREYKEIANIYEIHEKNAILIKKLNIISTLLMNLSYNVSIEQELDKFVIEMRDSNG